MELAPDFNEFCGLLNAHRVEFVIVGAYALAYHGAPRFTGDFDVFVRPTEANGERLITAIAAFGFPTDAFSPTDIASGRKVIQMGVEPVQIHVMSEISGVSWDEVWAGRSPGRCGDHDVSFIGREEFVKNTRAAVGSRTSPISRPSVRPRTLTKQPRQAAAVGTGRRAGYDRHR